MIETLCLVLILGAFAAFAWVPWFVLMQVAFGCAALGLGVGVPGALVYHVRLRACLIEGGELPAGWWVHPFGLHARLDREQLDRVLPPCWIGAAGGAVAFLGCLIGFLGVASVALQP